LIFLVSVAVLLLCWAALDDITTGSEPNHVVEWLMVGTGIIWFGGLIMARRWKRADT
jgi:hypothetical protein